MTVKLHWFDVEDLARAVLGLDEDADSNKVENALYEQFEIGFNQFHLLIEALIPLTVPAKTALGERLCHGFVKDGAFIIRHEQEPMRALAKHGGQP